jgi:hypothetical protein
MQQHCMAWRRLQSCHEGASRLRRIRWWLVWRHRWRRHRPPRRLFKNKFNMISSSSEREKNDKIHRRIVDSNHRTKMFSEETLIASTSTEQKCFWESMRSSSTKNHENPPRNLNQHVHFFSTNDGGKDGETRSPCLAS